MSNLHADFPLRTAAAATIAADFPLRTRVSFLMADFPLRTSVAGAQMNADFPLRTSVETIDFAFYFRIS